MDGQRWFRCRWWSVDSPLHPRRHRRRCLTRDRLHRPQWMSIWRHHHRLRPLHQQLLVVRHLHQCLWSSVPSLHVVDNPLALSMLHVAVSSSLAIAQTGWPHLSPPTGGPNGPRSDRWRLPTQRSDGGRGWGRGHDACTSAVQPLCGRGSVAALAWSARRLGPGAWGLTAAGAPAARCGLEQGAAPRETSDWAPGAVLLAALSNGGEPWPGAAVLCAHAWRLARVRGPTRQGRSAGDGAHQAARRGSDRAPATARTAAPTARHQEHARRPHRRGTRSARDGPQRGRLALGARRRLARPRGCYWRLLLGTPLGVGGMTPGGGYRGRLGLETLAAPI
jgi:hypothetical protein